MKRFYVRVTPCTYLPILSPQHTHTRTHTHEHAHTHTLIYTYTHTCTHTHRDIVKASHLSPLDRKDIICASRKQPWNSVARTTASDGGGGGATVDTQHGNDRGCSSSGKGLPLNTQEFNREWRRLKQSSVSEQYQ